MNGLELVELRTRIPNFRIPLKFEVIKTTTALQMASENKALLGCEEAQPGAGCLLSQALLPETLS